MCYQSMLLLAHVNNFASCDELRILIGQVKQLWISKCKEWRAMSYSSAMIGSLFCQQDAVIFFFAGVGEKCCVNRLWIPPCKWNLTEKWAFPCPILHGFLVQWSSNKPCFSFLIIWPNISFKIWEVSHKKKWAKSLTYIDPNCLAFSTIT